MIRIKSIEKIYESYRGLQSPTVLQHIICRDCDNKKSPSDLLLMKASGRFMAITDSNNFLHPL